MDYILFSPPGAGTACFYSCLAYYLISRNKPTNTCVRQNEIIDEIAKLFYTLDRPKHDLKLEDLFAKKIMEFLQCWNNKNDLVRKPADVTMTYAIETLKLFAPE